MKVSLISGSHGVFGGGQIYLDNMAKSLIRHGVDCKIYASDDVFSDSVKIKKISTWKDKVFNTLDLIRTINSNKREREIIILNDITLSMCSIFFRIRGVKVVSLIHMSLFNSARSGYFFENIYPRLRAFFINLGSDAIFNVNKENEQLLAKEKTFYVGNFIMDEQFSRLSHTPKEIDFLYVGRFDKEKRPTEFIDFIYGVNERLGGVKAAMIGDGELYSQVKSQIIKMGLSDVIKLYGFIPHDDIWQFFEKTKNIVITSKTEGFPTVILEAAKYGANFISYPLGTIPFIHSKYSIGIVANSIDDLVYSASLHINQYTDSKLEERLSLFSSEHTSVAFSKRIIKYLEEILN
ncbi:glycosyltransferase family 4 protein [Plesiomonas shigelloides]|uniref:glycosyltransferase family 4 protein n=1 Tax=Plesiomonas shigelloides TaxID=703 RepID=UPI00387F1D03